MNQLQKVALAGIFVILLSLTFLLYVDNAKLKQGYNSVVRASYKSQQQLVQYADQYCGCDLNSYILEQRLLDSGDLDINFFGGLK